LLTLSGENARLTYLPKALRLVWAAAPQWTSTWVVLLIIRGILPAVTVYITRAVVDSLLVAVDARGDWRLIQPALVFIALIAFLMLLSTVLDSVTAWVTNSQSELVQDYFSGIIHEQGSTLDLAFYETPEYYDLLERARNDAASQPLALLRNVGNLLQNSITLLGMLGVLLPFGVWIPFVLLVSTLPAFGLVINNTQRFNEWRIRTTVDRRRVNYYDTLLTNRLSAAEIRLYGLSEHFRNLYQIIRRRLRSEQLQLIRRRVIAEFAGGSLALLGTGGVMAWMVWRALQGTATLGDLTLFYQAFSRSLSLAASSLNSLGDIYRNSLFLRNLFEFLSLKANLEDPTDPLPVPILSSVELQFHHVSFYYPGSTKAALEDFSLSFPAGKITAIVGANGAGKSTLVKLLARFYDPHSGSVTLNGVDLRSFAQNDLRRQLTIMFQHPLQYATTVSENIALGDYFPVPDQARIEAAAVAAAADEPINRLPQGYATVLGKIFGGSELSAGEWQRVAQARAFLRRARVIVLDEPTSAIDSWAEAEWLSRFRTLVAGQTAIVITHRFTTAMQADIIHVMDEGRVIESGTHEELCALNGRYADSWQKQTRTAEVKVDANGTGH
jgi:ATP-binding cassette, subfamily B, bacterial